MQEIVIGELDGNPVYHCIPENEQDEKLLGSGIRSIYKFDNKFITPGEFTHKILKNFASNQVKWTKDLRKVGERVYDILVKKQTKEIISSLEENLIKLKNDSSIPFRTKKEHIKVLERQINQFKSNSRVPNIYGEINLTESKKKEAENQIKELSSQSQFSHNPFFSMDDISDEELEIELNKRRQQINDSKRKK